MPAPERVRRAYNQVRPLIRSVQSYIGQTLQPYCISNDYLFFERIKELDSLAEKLESGRYKAWSEIDDIYACTIVIPRAAHESAVIAKLDESFNRRVIRSRLTTKKAPDVFRFDTTRYYGTLREEAAVGRPSGICDVVFEIQIPTILQFAWSKVTHDLIYKGDTADWRKQRVAAHLKASIEQMELIVESFDHVASAVSESPWLDVEAKAAVVKAFKDLIDQGVVRRELQPLSWNRLADNVYALVSSYTKDPQKRAGAVAGLIEGLTAYLARDDSPPCPASGTLFQLVLSYVELELNGGSIAKYAVVDSEELSALYGLTNIPRAFMFDIPGAGESRTSA